MAREKIGKKSKENWNNPDFRKNQIEKEKKDGRRIIELKEIQIKKKKGNVAR